MATIEFQTEIDAPRDRVFALVSDLRNHVEWSGGEAIEMTSDGPISVGTTYETEERGPLGWTTKEQSVVTELHPDSRFAWRSYGPLGTWLDWSFDLEARDSRTGLTQRLEPKPGFLTALAMKLFIERQMRASMPESLVKLKEVAEQRASPE
jgi:uncharacterized protein YndB with AHSA1/START domain